MQFKRNEGTSEFKPHPKFVPGHVYRRYDGDLYLATKAADVGEYLYCMHNGNVWTTEDAPFGHEGRVVMWEDVDHMVFVDKSALR